MEFNQKLQELRKQKGLTQEDLAKELYVSRTAISKWESGRGYPGIDSLKSISSYFSVSIDELLSGKEILNLAKEDGNHKEDQLRGTVFALLDISTILLFFLPLFAQRENGTVSEVSLLSLSSVADYLKAAYITVTALIAIFGILTLVLQSSSNEKWNKMSPALSLALNSSAVLIFILSTQAYAAALTFIFLCIKVFLLIKRR